MDYPKLRTEEDIDGSTNVYWGNRLLGYYQAAETHYSNVYAVFFGVDFLCVATGEVEAVCKIEQAAQAQFNLQFDYEDTRDKVEVAFEQFVRVCKSEGRLPSYMQQLFSLVHPAHEAGLLAHDGLQKDKTFKQMYTALERCDWMLISIRDGGNDFPLVRPT